MDKHHAHVVAAAEAVRAWVVAQRAASWSVDSLDTGLHAAAHPGPVVVHWPLAAPGPEFTADSSTSAVFPLGPASVLPFPSPTQSGSFAADADAPFAAAVATSIALDTPPAAIAPAPYADPGLAQRPREFADSLRLLTSRAGPALRWTTRAALATGVAAGVVWAVRAYRVPASAPSAPAAPIAAVAGVAPVTATDTAKKPAAPEPPIKRTGRLQIDSDPSGALILVDGKEQGTTPLAVEDLQPGSHVVVFKSPKGTVQKTVTVSANRTVQVNEGIYAGWFHLSSPIELQVSAGGRTVRLDDASQVMLPPGTHTLTLANRPLNFQETRTVEITPGGTTSISIEPPTATLTVTASEPAQVSIDGDILGSAPITDHLTTIGTRDVTARSASGQIRHVTVTLPTEGARVDVDFSRP